MAVIFTAMSRICSGVCRSPLLLVKSTMKSLGLNLPLVLWQLATTLATMPALRSPRHSSHGSASYLATHSASSA